MDKYLGLFFLMLGVALAAFLFTQSNGHKFEKYYQALISEKLVESLKYDK